MKLTNLIRESFVRAAMVDVPQIDYREQKQKLLQDEAREKLPPKVRAIYDDKVLRHFLSGRYVHGCSVFAASDWQPSAALLKKIEGLDHEGEKQYQRRRELERQLKSVASSATTRKALAEQLPEFAQYLPAEGAPVNRTVPVLANVVAEFTKAGWPKGKKPAEAKRKAAA